MSYKNFSIGYYRPKAQAGKVAARLGERAVTEFSSAAAVARPCRYKAAWRRAEPGGGAGAGAGMIAACPGRRRLSLRSAVSNHSHRSQYGSQFSWENQPDSHRRTPHSVQGSVAGGAAAAPTGSAARSI